MKPLFLLCLCFLIQLSAGAQSTIISGRIVDRKSKQGLPGITILQRNTTNGVSSSYDGSFSLTVPGQLDSVTISLTGIGYEQQQHRLAAGSTTIFKLVSDQRSIMRCNMGRYPRYSIGLTSGVRYAPYGAAAQVFGQQVIRLPLDISGSYQTNFKSNSATTVAVSLPALPEVGSLRFSEKLEYQRLRADAANAQFTSYFATLSLAFNQKTPHPLPVLVIGAGYARYQPLHPVETSAAKGCGFGLGFRYYSPPPLTVYVQAQATRWPAYWQLQGSISRPISHHFQLALTGNQLRSYREISLNLSRYLYY